MPVESSFKTLLERWPESVPRRGIVLNTKNESSPFKSFMLSNDMVMFERTNPDALGARYVLLEYSGIAAIKIVDPTKAEAFNKLGFEGTLAIN